MTDERSAGARPDGNEDVTPGIPLPPELIDNIPEEIRDKYIAEISYVGHSGPLPPPWLLSQYPEDVQNVIVSESVENRRHRTNMESRRQSLLFIWDILTLAAAFVLAFTLISGSIDIIKLGQSVEGLLGIGGTVSLIAAAFLVRDRKKRRVQQEQQGPALPPSPPELTEQAKD